MGEVVDVVEGNSRRFPYGEMEKPRAANTRSVRSRGPLALGYGIDIDGVRKGRLVAPGKRIAFL